MTDELDHLDAAINPTTAEMLRLVLVDILYIAKHNPNLDEVDSSIWMTGGLVRQFIIMPRQTGPDTEPKS